MILSAILALTLAFDGSSFAEKFDALPKVVQQTAKAHMGDAFPVSITSTQSSEGWDYQVNLRVDGKYHDLVIDDKGNLKAIKDETELGALPPGPRAAIEKKAAAGALLSVEKITAKSQVTYGAVIRDASNGSLVQVQVSPDGTVTSK